MEQYQTVDTTGAVFGRPEQVEIDVVAHDGQTILLELKSSVSQGDVFLFQRKIAFYEQEESTKVDRAIIVSPWIDSKAKAMARKAGIATYTAASDVEA